MKAQSEKAEVDGPPDRAVRVRDRAPDQLGNARQRHDRRAASHRLRTAAAAGAGSRAGDPARRRRQRAAAALPQRDRGRERRSTIRAILGFRKRSGRSVWLSPVYFDGLDPFMTIAMPHAGRNAGSTVAEINLKFLSNFIEPTQIGKTTMPMWWDRAGGCSPIPIDRPAWARTLANLPQVARDDRAGASRPSRSARTRTDVRF